jgi:iron-sulfur cluster repair protein YtfE (RIC family)
MDITKLLEADHRQVEDLFTQIEEAQDADRTSLLAELEQALHAHMQLEETVLYPAMSPATGDEAVEEATVEHELARKGLADAMRLATKPGFGAALDAVKAGIEHHVDEEESEVFPKLRKDRRILESVATSFMQKRAELGLPMDADALAAASTKEELLAEAKHAGVESASSMSKAELAGALAQKMG